MKRAGFTMIELIFVIVILGILAAVALPKFAGVSDQANAQKCNAWVGTLNRTIGPSMWSNTLAASGGTIGAVTDTDFGVSADTTSLVNFIAIEDVQAACYGAAIYTDAATAWGAITTATSEVTFGANAYDINFTDGNVSESPRWSWGIAQ